MANNPFNRTIINARERPMSPDLNRNVSSFDRSIRDLLASIYTGRAAISPDGAASVPPTGFIGEAFKVRPASTPSMVLTVKKGFGFLYDATTQTDIDSIGGLNDLSTWKPAILNADVTVTVPSQPSGDGRIDIVEIKTSNLQIGEPTSRDVFNVSTGEFDANTVNKTLAWDYDGGIQINPYGSGDSTGAVALKQGQTLATPVAPATSVGYTKIAEILVGGGVTTIDSDVILDLRNMLFPGGTSLFGAQITSAPPFSDVVLERLNAPPGVISSAVWVSNTSNTLIFDIFFVSGASASSSVVAAWACAAVSTPGTPAMAITPSHPRATTLADQTELVSADADPQIKIALKQQITSVRVRVDITTLTSEASVNILFSNNG